MNEITDNDLLRQFLTGDDCGLTELVKRYQKDIYRFIYSMVGNESDAADLSQKVFVNVFLKAASYQGKSSFKTWLYQIAVNQCKNHFRSNDRRRLDRSGVDVDEMPNADYDIIDVCNSEEQRRILTVAVEKLPARQRAAIKLRLYSGCSLKETADIMAISVGTAKAHYHQAMTSLKISIQECDYEIHETHKM